MLKKHLFSNKAVKILLTTDSLVLIAMAMLGPIYALFVEKIGGDLLDASLTAGIFALAAGLTSLVAGQFADKVKEVELIVAFGYGVIGFGFILYLFVNSIWFLFLVQIITGFAKATFSPAFDSLYSKHIPRRRAASLWGAWEATDYFTTALGAAIGGLIVTQFGFNSLFAIMALLCFISAGYIYFLPRKVL